MGRSVSATWPGRRRPRRSRRSGQRSLGARPLPPAGAEPTDLFTQAVVLECPADLEPQHLQVDRLGDVVVRPRRIASTAVSIVPWAVITRIRVSGQECLMSRTRSRPESGPGIFRSVITSWWDKRRNRSQASDPSCAVATSYDSSSRASANPERMFGSSSTTRMRNGASLTKVSKAEATPLQWPWRKPCFTASIKSTSCYRQSCSRYSLISLPEDFRPPRSCPGNAVGGSRRM